MHFAAKLCLMMALLVLTSWACASGGEVYKEMTYFQGNGIGLHVVLSAQTAQGEGQLLPLNLNDSAVEIRWKDELLYQGKFNQGLFVKGKMWLTGAKDSSKLRGLPVQELFIDLSKQTVQVDRKHLLDWEE